MPQAEKKDGTIQHGRFREYAVASPVRVDAEKGVIHDALILGNVSRNRVDYPTEVMQEAISRYEGAAVFVGHSRDGQNPEYDRKLGVIRNPHVTADGIRGEVHYPPKHRLAEQLAWDSVTNPQNIGLSHDADCTYSLDAKGRKRVAKIERVFSVDLVTRPATTRGLFEDEEPSNDPVVARLRETCLCAEDGIRKILFESGTAADSSGSSAPAGQDSEEAGITKKKTRIVEALREWIGELQEGEIGDEMAEDEPLHKMRRMADIASRHLDNARWDSQKYPTHDDKRKRHLEILSDWTKELKSLQCGNTLKEEESKMPVEFKEITVEQLQKERPDLVATLTKTDEKSRLTEELATAQKAAEAKDAEIAALKAQEAKRLKEESLQAALKKAEFPVGDKAACSDRFMEQLRAADPKEWQAIIDDRLTLCKGRMQEAALPSPFTDLRPTPADKPLDQDRTKRFFG